MAAWIVVAAVAGVVVGAVAQMLWDDRALRLEREMHNDTKDAFFRVNTELAAAQATIEGMRTAMAVTGKGEPDLMERLIDRLMDTALPKHESRVADEPPPDTPGDYEPPDEPVQDWTDPFFGIERETVGSLRPGQAIPGIGRDDEVMPQFDDEYDALAGDPRARGFEPVDDAPREGWQDIGYEAFEEWEQEQRR